MSGRKAVPWAAVGFIAGGVLGFAWGQKAKSRVGESVSTDWEGGVLSVKVNTVQAARAGLPDLVNQYLSKNRG